MNRDISNIIKKYLDKHPSSKYLTELQTNISLLNWDDVGYYQAFDILNKTGYTNFNIRRTGHITKYIEMDESADLRLTNKWMWNWYFM